MRRVFVLVLAVAGFACHGKGPGGSTLPTGSDHLPQSVTFVSGRTGQTLAGVVPPVAVVGDVVTIDASGFLSLRTTWWGAPLVLCPADADLPAEVTRGLVYPERIVDPSRLHRWPVTTTVIRVEPLDIFVSGKVRQDLETAVQVLSVQHPSLDFVVASPGDVTIGTDPDDPFWQTGNYFGAAYSDVASNGSLKKGRIVFRYADQVQQFAAADGMLVFILHEIGHATGLDHLPAPYRGVMSPSLSPGEFRGFTEREQLAIHMQYLRQPGTRLVGTLEDETVATSASANRIFTTVIGN